MASITQQRLIGSFLLLCVLGAVAFFLINSASNDVEIMPNTEPDIPFVSSIDAISEENINIVAVEQEALIDAQKPEVDAQSKTDHQQEVDLKPIQKIPEIKTISKPLAKKTTLNITMWSLQIASLADHSAAIALSEKVNKLGYKALVEKAETSKGDRFRVRIGPDKNKAVLEKISKTLEKELKLKPLLLKQQPG